MTDSKKPSVAFWATVALVTVLVVYPLSFGPAVSLCHRADTGYRAIGIIYRPIFMLAARHRESENLLRKYAHVCGVSKSIEPMMTEAGIFGWIYVGPKILHR